MSATALFGGTFDPVHNTHLAIARLAADTFGLDKVLFVPAGTPPLKTATLASFEDRVAMLTLAISADPRFEVSRIEDPAVRSGPSYSILTVEALHQAGVGRLLFLIGADAFADLPDKWYRWQDLVRSVEFIVIPRPGFVYASPPGATVHALPSLDSPVSSSAVRDALRNNARDLPLPAAVLRYILERRLYQSQKP